MTNLIRARCASIADSASLDEKLEWMKQFGQPRLGVYGSGTGWHCTIAMHVNSVGATFDISGDFKSLTPADAVDQCIHRMRDTLQQMGAAA